MSTTDHLVQSGDPAISTAQRAVHFVGSLPPELARTDAEAMSWFLEHSAPGAPLTLPCDRDPNWIIGWLTGLADRAPFAPVLTGSSASYTDLPTYRLLSGARLTAADVGLGREAQVAEAMDARSRLGTTETLPPHQVSIPAPLDLVLFMFGVPSAALRQLTASEAMRAVRSALVHLPTMTAIVAAEVSRIQQRWGDEVVFQLETPAVLVGVDRTPPALWPVVTRLLARQTAAVITACPTQTRFLLHGWCHGDLGHQPISTLQDLRPLVAFANTLAMRLQRAPQPRRIPPLHAALCDGFHPPSKDPATYAPLQALAQEIEMVAGLVDETAPEHSRAALHMTEQALDRPVTAVSAACGHGRRSPQTARANAELAQELAVAPLLPAVYRKPHTARKGKHG